jgi:hypothetical protein
MQLKLLILLIVITTLIGIYFIYSLKTKPGIINTKHAGNMYYY